MTQDSITEKSSTSANYDRNVAASLTRPLVLIGMMGSGKSRVGQILGEILALPYADCDREIEEACGCSISDYFTRYGEDAFRAGEARVLARLLDGTPKIVSAGGGIVLKPENRALLKEKAVAVWLQADVAVLAARCAGTAKRPLLQNGNPRQVLTELLEKRGPFYEETAAFSVSSNHEDPADTAREVLDALAAYLRVRT